MQASLGCCLKEKEREKKIEENKKRRSKEKRWGD